MTAFDRFDRVFEDVLADLAQPTYPDYIDNVLARATTGSQRPAWTFPERWFPMSTIARPASLAPGLPWRNVAILALLALLAATILAVAIGTQQRLAPPYGPADNGLIVYQLGGDIYARDALDGAERVLIGGEQTDVYPFFSLDGSRLAFLRIDPATAGMANEQVTLLVADPDGTKERLVAGPSVILDVAWSPNGKDLAVLDEVGGTPRLSVVPVDGGTPRVIDFEGRITNRVAWRPPHGNELVVLAEVNNLTSFYAIAADGTGHRLITGNQDFADSNNFSLAPDGRVLTFMNMAWPFSIGVLDLESGALERFGKNLPPLSPGEVHAGGVRLSADGLKLVFGRYWDERDGSINHQIWVASLAGDGADGVAITPVLRTPSGADPFLVMTAPDDSQILLHHLGTTDTWITDFSGSNTRVVDWGSIEESDWQRVAP